MDMNEEGSATVAMSVLGSVVAGAPIAAGVVLTSDNVAGAVVFTLALIVGLLSVGTGVGRVYSRWKLQIEATVTRDRMLVDMGQRMQRMEDRQLQILERLDRHDL